MNLYSKRNNKKQIELVASIDGSNTAQILESGESAAPILRDDSRSGVVDVLSQLKANVHQLEDLSFRMGFMMNEIKGIVKK